MASTIRLIADNVDLCRLFLLLGVVFVFLVPQTVAMVQLFSPWWGEVCAIIVNNMNAHFFLGYSVYFMWGYWLHKHTFSNQFVFGCIVLGGSSVAITIWLTSSATKCAGAFDGRFYEASNVTAFLPATAVFVSCKHWLGKVKEGTFARILASLAQLCFGGYLIHAFLFEHLVRSLHLWGLEFQPLVGIPTTALVVFALSLLAASLLARIPYAGKWLF